MIDFNFTLKTEIFFGKTAIDDLGPLIKRFGKNILILYGSDRIEKKGLLEEIEKRLLVEGIKTIRLGGVRENPDADFSQRVADLCRKEKLKFILAVGGGSVMDTAKAAAIGACSKHSIWEVYSTGKPIEEALPIGAIVTLPATASESNGTSVISNDKTHEKKVLFSKETVPQFAIMNPEYTLSLPALNTAAAAIDIFSHCFERYFDLRYKSMIRGALCGAVMRVVINITPQILRDPKNYELRSELMWAADIAHNDILGVGGDFACHELSHALTAQYGLSHGVALSIVMPAWCKYSAKKYKEPFCEFAREVWQKENAEDGIREMERFIRGLNLAVTLKEAGIENINVEKLVEKIFNDGRKSIGGGFAFVYEEDARNIFKIATSS